MEVPWLQAQQDEVAMLLIIAVLNEMGTLKPLINHRLSGKAR